MPFGELRPLLTALVLPPILPLLLVLLGLLLAAGRRRARGLALALAGTALLWILSCHAVATALAGALLPPVRAAQPAQLAGVQAIVVLGGGIVPDAPEYGAAQPNAPTLARLRYGAWLARRSGKPLAFAGGVGWGAAGTGFAPEAEVAGRTLRDDWGVAPRWLDGRSRDTGENAREMRRLLAADQVSRIALVTDAWHMPRSVLEFERAGFTVLPAPTGFPAPQVRPLLDWLPSPDGLALSRQVLREVLGLAVARLG
ncbi:MULTISPECIES: YdcF family protein [Ramlibacter]|uniref:YdcF family protein n=1 Tax=Ramlibacter pinisoli TaxID=2682844 RepID=A0A6N8IRV6_9BURK|nr:MULTISPECIES: YdcF family protein [Ramlibacter]MBA2964496.1 YdcF family protein [Ramlibacter sp. CGMCC 1.13660]MVQ29462.1 YdcF family protein [Ramlibacter pinisoli]